MIRLLMIVVLALSAAACQVIGRGGDDNSSANVPRPTTVLINWDRSPSTVVFRADVVGGDASDAFFWRSEIPRCTIYGDGRIIWSVGSFEDQNRVLWDTLTDQQIQQFIEKLVVHWKIYNYDAQVELVMADAVPVVEQITLNINDVAHVTDVFGGWDHSFFADILSDCSTLAQMPTVYEPEGAWVAAQVTEYDLNAPINLWSAQATGVDLRQLADSGERQWVTGRTLRLLWIWTQQAPPTLQFSQGDGTFHVALEIPNVTRDAPQPPQ